MRKLKSKRARIILSVMALAEVLILIVGVTFSWIEGGNKGNVNGNDIVISTGSNLTMKYGNKVTNSITIPKCDLDEVSSADGRNYYFPLKDNTSSETSQMKFREGTPADENKKYLSIDFQLTADKGAVDVYLGAGTLVQCSNENVSNALRMSFSKNDGSTPTVFKPSQMPGINMPYYPIVSITEDGTPQTSTVNTKAYADYSYNGAGSTPIFHIDGGQTLNITLSLWLEGTEFNSDDVANQDLGIYIDFTTINSDLIKYNFIDNTHGYDGAAAEYWVAQKADSDKYETMMYIYDTDSERYYTMRKSVNFDTDHTWSCYIPSTVENITFRRYTITVDTYWNQWEPDMGTAIVEDPNGEYTYVAICGNTKNEVSNNDGCYGYWKDKFDTIRVYIDEKNSTGWGQVVCKAYGKKSDGTKGWTSYDMTWFKNTDDGDLWYCDIKYGSTITGIRFFSSGNEADRFEFFENETQYYFNGFATWYKDNNHNGKYDDDTKKHNTHWVYVDSLNSLIHPDYEP